MSQESQIDALIATIREQLRTTDRAALRQRLIDDGVDPALIDQAFARIDANAARPTPPLSHRGATESPTHPAVSQAETALAGSAIDPAYVARLKGYLEQHRGTYAREALQQKLLADGHDPQAVSLAMAQVYGYEVAPGAPPLTATPGSSTAAFILALLGTFLFNYTVVLALAIGASGIDQNGIVSLAIPVLALIGEVVAAVVLRRRNRAIARGLAWGIAASLLPVAALALLFGICLALLGGL